MSCVSGAPVSTISPTSPSIFHETNSLFSPDPPAREKLPSLLTPSTPKANGGTCDTIYAEGQRRYLESLSAHARHHLSQLPASAVDTIEGLSPTLAVEQRQPGGSARSTLATATEIHDHLRVLFANHGTPHDSKTGKPLLSFSPQQIVDQILEKGGTRSLILLAPLSDADPARLKKEGFLRIRKKNRIVEIDEASSRPPLELIIDRLALQPSVRGRLTDSVELALRLSHGKVVVAFTKPDFSELLPTPDLIFSTQPTDSGSGAPVPDRTPRNFSFNSPEGACPDCSGLGAVPMPDPAKIIPDPSLPIDRGAIAPWNRAHPKMRAFYRTLAKELARKWEIPPSTPYTRWPEKLKKILLHGSAGKPLLHGKPWEGLIPEMARQLRELRSDSARARLLRFFSHGPCLACSGSRLQPSVLQITLGGPPGQGHSIASLCRLSVSEARIWLANLPPPPGPAAHAFPPLQSAILQRLSFLEQLGLGYLTLDRTMDTLSGGEYRRSRLATQVGGGLTGVLYVLDEPSIGLHPSDHSRLLDLLFHLRDLGNSLLVVEHDEETIRRADHIVEFGPGAGSAGGQITAQGTPKEIATHANSLTGAFLSGRRKINRSAGKKEFSSWLKIRGVTTHNLKQVDASFPLEAFTCVTGVSGSGKSSLVFDTLAPALLRHLGSPSSAPSPGSYDSLSGHEHLTRAVVIDQTPLSRQSRSHPLSLLGVWDDLRELFASLPSAKARGFGPSRFSFNVRGGRCETCSGQGEIFVQLHLLPEAIAPCPACHGQRYNRETLTITYRGHSIGQILGLPVDRAYDLLRSIPPLAVALGALQKVGLGYLPVGQSADRLSGGEAQRVRLAAALAQRTRGPALYLLDEPTTGLHLAEVENLLSVFFDLCDSGHTLVVVEHHPDMIRHADYILDLGPGGGQSGGHLVASGTPEEISLHPTSPTGKILARP
ncbi:excinuclease ABC subunit A [bacterium]|nr:excinuclease ABC subunit A [bacterium]